jgi:ATP-dependent DNA helicase RecG
MNLRTSRKFSEKEWERQDEYVVPMSALREGVMNALVHRDYSVPSASMSVIIYSDKIEIFNSGKSPLKAAELRKSHLSLPVNPDIAHMAFLRGYIEKIGRGTIKIMDACKAAGLKAPKWTTSETSVKLSFPLNVKLGGANDGADDGAKDDELFFKLDGAIDGAIDGATKATKRKLSVLLKAIVSNEGKRTPDYKEITKLGSERTMERYIEQLKEVGFIEFKGTAAQTGGYFTTDKLKKIISS